MEKDERRPNQLEAVQRFVDAVTKRVLDHTVGEEVQETPAKFSRNLVEFMRPSVPCNVDSEAGKLVEDDLFVAVDERPPSPEEEVVEEEYERPNPHVPATKIGLLGVELAAKAGEIRGRMRESLYPSKYNDPVGAVVSFKDPFDNTRDLFGFCYQVNNAFISEDEDVFSLFTLLYRNETITVELPTGTTAAEIFAKTNPDFRTKTAAELFTKENLKRLSDHVKPMGFLVMPLMGNMREAVIVQEPVPVENKADIAGIIANFGGEESFRKFLLENTSDRDKTEAYLKSIFDGVARKTVVRPKLPIRLNRRGDLWSVYARLGDSVWKLVRETEIKDESEDLFIGRFREGGTFHTAFGFEYFRAVCWMKGSDIHTSYFELSNDEYHHLKDFSPVFEQPELPEGFPRTLEVPRVKDFFRPLNKLEKLVHLPTYQWVENKPPAPWSSCSFFPPNNKEAMERELKVLQAVMQKRKGKPLYVDKSRPLVVPMVKKPLRRFKKAQRVTYPKKRDPELLISLGLMLDYCKKFPLEELPAVPKPNFEYKKLAIPLATMSDIKAWVDHHAIPMRKMIMNIKPRETLWDGFTEA